MSAAAPVDLSIEGGVARIRLNRPDRLNALDLSTARALRAALVQIQRRDDVSLVVLSGSGSAFCAGGDVTAMHASNDRSAFLRELVGEMNQVIEALLALPVVVVAAVHGVVAGGGIGLMLTADVVLAAEGTRFLSAYGSIGLSPDCGMTVLLPLAVGHRRTLDFILRAQTISAETALAWGMVAEVVAPGALDDRLGATIAGVLAIPNGWATVSRRLVRTSVGLREQLAAEASAIAQLAGTDAAGRAIDTMVNRSSSSNAAT